MVDAIGHQTFNGLIGECVSIPHAEYEKVSDAADILLKRIVDRIDWNRVLLEAMNRHHELVRSKAHRETGWDKFAGNPDSEVCPDCLRECLLALDTFPCHDPQPAERFDTGQDVFATFAAAIVHRGS